MPIPLLADGAGGAHALAVDDDGLLDHSAGLTLIITESANDPHLLRLVLGNRGVGRARTAQERFQHFRATGTPAPASTATSATSPGTRTTGSPGTASGTSTRATSSTRTTSSASTRTAGTSTSSRSTGTTSARSTGTTTSGTTAAATTAFGVNCLHQPAIVIADRVRCDEQQCERGG